MLSRLSCEVDRDCTTNGNFLSNVNLDVKSHVSISSESIAPSCVTHTVVPSGTRSGIAHRRCEWAIMSLILRERHVGTFTHPITLYSDDRSVAETVDALVDADATFLTMPADMLDRLGVEPFQSVTLRLANGEVEQRRIGKVRVQLDGQERTAVCVFGESSAPPIIGVGEPSSPSRCSWIRWSIASRRSKPCGCDHWLTSSSYQTSIPRATSRRRSRGSPRALRRSCGIRRCSVSPAAARHSPWPALSSG